MASIFNFNLCLLAAALLLVFTLALVAKYQPYEYKRNNAIDTVMLLAIISRGVGSFKKVGGHNCQ